MPVAAGLAEDDVLRTAVAPAHDRSTELAATFQPELWHRMAAGPTYDRRFDQVTWTPGGEAAAAATGWFAGAGRCAILEPVGTHADHRGSGYGRRVSLGVMSSLARAGASGVRVHTPAANTAAVRAYESCGLGHVDWTTALVRPGPPS